jgi:ribosomal protein L29
MKKAVAKATKKPVEKVDEITQLRQEIAEQRRQIAMGNTNNHQTVRNNRRALARLLTAKRTQELMALKETA